jgi:hypothetical protein
MRATEVGGWTGDHFACVAMTANLNNRPGLRSFKNVRRCMRSFSASSSKVWIQPWSRSIRRSDRMCRSIPAVCQITSYGIPLVVCIHQDYHSRNSRHCLEEDCTIQNLLFGKCAEFEQSHSVECPSSNFHSSIGNTIRSR